MTLRGRLAALLATAVVPLFLLLVFHAYGGWRDLAREAERAALDHARSIAADFGAAIGSARQAVTAIALRAQDEGFDASACLNYLSSVIAAEPRFFSAAVIAADGRVVCRSHPGPADLPEASRRHLAAAMDGDGVVLGDVVADPVRGVPSLPVALAYRDAAARTLGAAVLTLDLDRLTAALAGPISPDQGFAAVVDRRGAIALQVPEQSSGIGEPLPAAMADAFADRAPRVLAALDRGGQTYLAALAPVESAAGDMAILVGLDRVAALAPARAVLFLHLGIAALATALALVGGWLMGARLIERPLRGLIETAQRRADGDVAARFPADAADREFGRLGAALNATAARFERLMGEKTLAMRDVQHRVMNSLHLLGAILHLHSRQVSDEAVRRHLNDARERIVSISVIYRHLCEKDALHTVDFAGVLRGLCAEASDAYLGERPPIEVEADEVTLPIETAMNLALITHELIVGAMKHRDSPPAQALRVELHRAGDALELAVNDPRKGPLPAFAAEAGRSSSLGMMIVHSLTRQLRGRFAVERRAGGICFAVALPLSGTPGTESAPRQKLVA